MRLIIFTWQFEWIRYFFWWVRKTYLSTWITCSLKYNHYLAFLFNYLYLASSPCESLSKGVVKEIRRNPRINWLGEENLLADVTRWISFFIRFKTEMEVKEVASGLLQPLCHSQTANSVRRITLLGAFPPWKRLRKLPYNRGGMNQCKMNN